MLLATAFSDDADSSIVTIPFLLVGAGFGMLASQLGNVVGRFRLRDAAETNHTSA